MPNIKSLELKFYRFKNRHPRFMMSLLVFVLIPIASGIILGYEMKSDVPTEIPTIIVNHDQSQFSQNFVGFVENSEYFNVVEYGTKDSEVEESMTAGRTFAGIIIPENFYQDMRAGKSPKILTVYDGASLTLVTTSKSAMSEILLTAKGAYMMSIFEGKLNTVPEQVMNYVTPISVNYKFLFNPTKSFRNYLLIGMLAAVIQVGIAMQGAERGYENQQSRRRYLKQIWEIAELTALSTVAIILCLGVQHIFFDMPYEGSLPAGLILTILYAMSIVGIGYIAGTLIPDRVFSIQVSAIIVLPTSILGGYTYPIYGMPESFRGIAQLIPFYHYGQDLRHLCMGDMIMSDLTGSFRYFVGFIAVEVLILFIIHAVYVTIEKNGRERAARRADKKRAFELKKARIMEFKPYAIVAVIPIIFTLLFGYIFGPLYINDVPIAILDMDQSHKSREIIANFYDSDVLDITEGMGSVDEIEREIISGKLCGAILIPEGFGKNIAGKQGAEAVVLMDHANFMFGNTLMSAINTIFETVNGGIQLKYLEAGSQVPFQAKQSVFTLGLVDRILHNPQLGYYYYMFPGFLAIFVQQTYLAAMVPMLIEEKDRLKNLPESLNRQEVRIKKGLMLRRMLLLVGVGMVSTMACIKIAVAMNGMFMQGEIANILVSQVVFLASVTGLGILIAAMFEQVAHGAQFTMFLTIPTFLSCGYAWPYYLVEDWFAGLLKMIWPMYYFVNPLKDTMMKGSGLNFDMLASNLIFALAWMLIGTLAYTRKVRNIRRYHRL